MKLLLFLLYMSPMISPAQTGKNNDATKREIMELETRLLKLWLAADSNSLNKYITTDYKEIYDQGETIKRKDIFRSIQPHPEVSFRDTMMNIDLYDNTAVVTAIWEFKNSSNAMTNYMHFTDVFVKQNGSWKNSLSQESEVPAWRVRKLQDADFTPLTALSCEQESAQKSLNASTQTFIRFKNNTAETLNTEWIDYSGKRSAIEGQIRPIPAGQFIEFRTYVTHPFVVTGTNNKCYGIYLPAQNPSLVTIQNQ